MNSGNCDEPLTYNILALYSVPGLRVTVPSVSELISCPGTVSLFHSLRFQSPGIPDQRVREGVNASDRSLSTVSRTIAVKRSERE